MGKKRPRANEADSQGTSNAVPRAAKDVAQPGTPKSAFPVVGIGASAGGLDAFKKFFSAMPADSGMAFVLVPHLDPSHRSLMAELLGRQTDMPVSEVDDGMAVEPNCVYIIPPNKDLKISEGTLYLQTPEEPRRLQTAIDFFLRSLAKDQQEQAIAIILSGTGSHGTLGVKEIKLAGGMVMVQAPDSADYDQMPRSAIATGLVDYVLPPEDMPNALVGYSQQPYIRSVRNPSSSDPASEGLYRILALLRAHVKCDFRSYRKSMLLRRIQRRMSLVHIAQVDEYLEYLRDQRDELQALYKDLLIGVTAFFREKEAFEVLKQRVIPEFVKRQEEEVPVRVWVPGCATGEEAYSIAILFLEEFETTKKPGKLQVFATDIDEQSLEIGRRGVYAESIAGDISRERLQRFFVKPDSDHYQVNKQLRDSVVFAPQNLISDAPFSRLDLISCRNVLIYLDPEVQQKVVALFHFALNKDGTLLLGPSESIGPHIDLFEPVSKKWRVYRRIGPIRRELIEIPVLASENRPVRRPQSELIPAPTIRLAELTQSLLLKEYAPAAVLIDRKHEILYYFGPISQFLDLPTGEPTKDLIAMARQGLRTSLRNAIHRAFHECQTVRDARVRVERNNAFFPCSITVRPITQPPEAAGLLLVAFQDRIDEPEQRAEHETAQEIESAVIRQLEYELSTTREDLQSTIEEMESANEELKASNEEVMSMNEELQSTNEELETSKEELQSLNEELSTVNSQLQDKLDELDKARNDITNLLNSTAIATVFLDTELRVQRFTPSIGKLLSLVANDAGRPITDFSTKFQDEDLIPDARRVLDKLAPVDREVKTDEGRWFTRRILPYRTQDNRIDGVVITFHEITDRKRTEERIKNFSHELELEVQQRTSELALSARRMQAILDTAADAIITIDSQGIIETFNPAAERIFGFTAEEAIGSSVNIIMPASYDAAHGVTREVSIIEGGRELLGRRKHGSTFPVDLSVAEFHDGNERMYASIIRDVSERKALQLELLQTAENEQRRIGQNLHDDVGQRLTAIAYQIHTLIDLLGKPARPELTKIAKSIASNIKESQEYVQLLVRGLVPIIVDSEGLVSALRMLADETSLQYDAQCSLKCNGSVPISDDVTATNLYYIVKEAINNAVKHSQGQRINITLYTKDHRIVVDVIDDGIGIGKLDLTRGMGLRIMTYRAGLIGASIDFWEREQGGTIVRCALPAEQKA